MENKQSLERLQQLLQQRETLENSAISAEEKQTSKQAVEDEIQRLIPAVETLIEAEQTRLDGLEQALSNLPAEVTAGHVTPEAANQQGRRIQQAITDAQARIDACQQALANAAPGGGRIHSAGELRAREQRLNESRVHLFCIALLTAATVFLPWFRPGPGLSPDSLYHFGPWFAAETGVTGFAELTWVVFALVPLLAAASALATDHRRAGYGVTMLGGLCLVLYLGFFGLYLGHPEGARMGISGATRSGGAVFCLGAALLVAHGLVRRNWRETFPLFDKLRWLSGLYAAAVLSVGVFFGLMGGAQALTFSTDYDANEHQVVTTLHNTGRETVRLFLPWPEGAPFRNANGTSLGGLIRVHDPQSGAFPVYPETRDAWSVMGHPRTEEGAVEAPPGGTLTIVIDLNALREAGAYPGVLRVEYTDGRGKRVHGVEVSGGP